MSGETGDVLKKWAEGWTLTGPAEGELLEPRRLPGAESLLSSLHFCKNKYAKFPPLSVPRNSVMKDFIPLTSRVPPEIAQQCWPACAWDS